MNQKICHVLTYMVMLCVTHVLSNNRWASSKNQLQTPEGSGSYPGSGPGTDDEDVKLPPTSRQSTVRRPAASFLPQPTTRSKSKPKQPSTQRQQLSGDEGSGMTPDTERSSILPQEKTKKLSTGPLMLSEDKRKKTPPKLPVRTCKEVAASGRTGGFRIPYKPHCLDNGDYSPLQCASSDCFCVNSKDGTIIESTRMVPGKRKILCHWVRYRIEIPLPSQSQILTTWGRYKEKLMNEINRTASLLMGRNLFTFKKFLSSPSKNDPTGIELECRSIGLIENYPLRSSLRKILAEFRTKLGNLDLLNVTEVTGKSETADTSNAGKSGYSVRNGEDSKTPGDDPKPASGASPSKKGNDKKMATLFEQPGIIAAIIGGGIAAFLLAILLILFCIYRIRKKDEGSYALEEPKKTPVSAAVYHSAPTREYYA